MTNHGHKAFLIPLKDFSDMKLEDDKCIFMLITAMWITPDRWHNNDAKIHQSESCLSFWTLT